MSKCWHWGSVDVETSWVGSDLCAVGFTAACQKCGKRGNTCGDPYVARASLKYDLNTADQFFRIVEIPRCHGKRNTFNPALGAPYGDLRSQPYTTTSNYMTFAEIAERFPHLKENTVPTPISQQPNQTPYWIVVSDDGPSTYPVRHNTKTLAESEALRLTEKNPNKTFTVFESKTSYLTPKADTKKTEFAAPYAQQMFYFTPGFGWKTYPAF